MQASGGAAVGSPKKLFQRSVESLRRRLTHTHQATVADIIRGRLGSPLKSRSHACWN